MKMAPEKKQSLVPLQRLRTPALVVLLLLVETLLGMRFQCPPVESAIIIYSLLYLLLPASFLVISNLLLRPRRSSAAFPSQPPPPVAHILFLVLQLGKAPLIWVFIVLLNERFLSCLFINLDYETKRRLFPSLQICGLSSLVLCLMLEYYSPRFPFLQKHLPYCSRKRHEELVLREVEVVAQEAADEKRRTYVQSMMGPDLEKLQPGDPGMQDALLRLVQHYQEKLQRGYTARGAEPGAQEPQSQGPPPIPT